MTPELWIALIAGSGGFFATVRYAINAWSLDRRETAEAQKVVADEIFEMRVMMAATIERDRRRDNRRKREASNPPPLPSIRGRVPTPQAHPVVKSSDFEVEETTDMHEVMEETRQSLSQTRSSVRPPARGQHHDKER